MFGAKKKAKEMERLEEDKKIKEYEKKLEEGAFEEKDKESTSSEQEDKVVKASVDSANATDEDIAIGFMRPENFGVLLPLIKDINVTDINWNGSQLWIDDLTKGRYMSDIVLSTDFVDAFATRVSNVVSETFNKYCPVLEAETEELRVSVLHDSISKTGTSISIRKTPAVKRINFAESIKAGDYCSVDIANVMSNAVKAKLNIVVCGLPGVGKTELVKYLTGYIFPHDRAITIEDNLEIHYQDINPNKDCLMLKVNDSNFTYVDAIKASLRQLPQWIILSEARSVEVKYLLESLSTGAKCLTTIHTDDVRKLPDRIKNMIGDSVLADRVENEVFSSIDVAILINKRVSYNQELNHDEIKRYIDQVAIFDRDDKGNNTCNLIFNEGKRTDVDIQPAIQHKFELAGIKDPYKYTFI